MVLAIDDAFRKTSDYRQWMDGIRKDFPHMPLYLAEIAMACHLADPQAYKEHVKRKTPVATPKPPTTVTFDGVKILPPEQNNKEDEQQDPTVSGLP